MRTAGLEPGTIGVMRLLGAILGLALGACTDGPSNRIHLPTLTIATHAAAHAASVAELERFEDAACRGLSRAARAACPFVQPVVLKAIPRGIRIQVQPDDAAEIAARMRCHLAYAKARGFRHVTECPLYLPSVEIELTEQRDAIEVTSIDPEVAGELIVRATESYGR